ncbi:ABC-three component system middle component 6 [Streptomonospora alba]|uniref:ABC-three component system middle component 6 n=1 Tax=Streptomonospora alba TaxID=183763 RepID=UPI00373AEF47
MLLPSKAIGTDQAIISVGAQILIQLEHPGSVSAVWERFSKWRIDNKLESSVPFWWFSLALDFLFTVGAIDFQEEQLVRTSHASKTV